MLHVNDSRQVVFAARFGTLSRDDDDGSEDVAKKMDLRSFKLNRVFLDPLNMSNAANFPEIEFVRILAELSRAKRAAEHHG